MSDPASPGPADGRERDLQLAGFLTFVDRPKADASASFAKLNRLGIAVKFITGDNGTGDQRSVTISPWRSRLS